MGYFLTTESENAVPPKFCATPKTHTPGPPVKERGYRYYMPELGRWASRDPISLASGDIGPFLFVDNHPVNAIDLLGESEFSLNFCDPKKGEGASWEWSAEMADTDLGVTQPISITACGCPLADSSDKAKGCNLSCKFGVVQVIKLNIKKFNPNDLTQKGTLTIQTEPGGPLLTKYFTPAEAYGHEQRHVDNILKSTKKVMKEWYDAEEAKLKGASLSSCQERLKTIASDAEAFFQKNVKAPEAKHPGIPAEATPYDPLGNNFPGPKK